jgi:hypothetical protein
MKIPSMVSLVTDCDGEADAEKDLDVVDLFDARLKFQKSDR